MDWWDRMPLRTAIGVLAVVGAGAIVSAVAIIVWDLTVGRSAVG